MTTPSTVNQPHEAQTKKNVVQQDFETPAGHCSDREIGI
jgi:hypothetical protein